MLNYITTSRHILTSSLFGKNGEKWLQNSILTAVTYLIPVRSLDKCCIKTCGGTAHDPCHTSLVLPHIYPSPIQLGSATTSKRGAPSPPISVSPEGKESLDWRRCGNRERTHSPTHASPLVSRCSRVGPWWLQPWSLPSMTSAAPPSAASSLLLSPFIPGTPCINPFIHSFTHPSIHCFCILLSSSCLILSVWNPSAITPNFESTCCQCSCLNKKRHSEYTSRESHIEFKHSPTQSDYTLILKNSWYVHDFTLWGNKKIKYHNLQHLYLWIHLRQIK